VFASKCDAPKGPVKKPLLFRATATNRAAV
jgi:hypothetical protein